MIVVDASVIAPALADDDLDGDLARKQLVAPEVLDLEVVSVFRKALLAGKLDERRAALALRDLVDLNLERVSHRSLLPRIWELHQNVTPYGAEYVALAETIGVPLIIADRRLAHAPGLRCVIECLDRKET